MTALEEIKKANHPDRIWATVNGMSTRLPDGARQLVGGWSQDADRAGAAEYVLASTLESLQRENEEKSAWIKAATTEITKAIGGGSEMFTTHGDEFRVDPAFVSSFIQYRRERHAESKKASIQKERELLDRAEAAEAEVKRLRDLVWRARDISRPSVFPTWHKDANEALASTGGEHNGN